MAAVDVLVIGSGVSGLSTAVCLTEAGLRVGVRAAAGPAGTTSAVAGALWMPYLVEPRHRVAGWSERTLTELRGLASDPSTGVRLVTGTRELVPDPAVRPVRGQVVVVENPGIEEFFAERPEPEQPGSSTELRYVLPHRSTVVLGGTAEPDRTDLVPRPEVARLIVDRCVAVVPALAGARVVTHRVGLRPVRDQVRLEAEVRGGGWIIHNYGHGGGGVTLSWGCAREVTELALAH